jgi:DNA mismatch repair protein MutL
MAHITVLDQNTINKIAAGEVIERPASVVKELLENAIDAKATAVTVEIRDGGISFIRVTDNGSGIPKEEVPTAFLRHSTSKIQSVEDLFTVSSLGFRGEALSSIAAVAKVELITKTPEQISGTRYQIEGGKERTLEEIGAPEGTTFLVRDLFYNTPARQKFLKTAQTEGAHVASLVEKIAMSHPEVSVRLIQNNQNKLHTSGNHNLKDMIYTVFGREIAANLLPVEHEEEIFSIRGFAGKPVIARSNRNFENYFINGRYVKSSLVAKAIEEAYRPFLMQHKYPFVLLHLKIEPEYLDVNVHPTKMELRFREEEEIYKKIYEAVSRALAQKELIPQVSLDKKKDIDEEKREEKRAPHPEPFEVRRKEEAEKKLAQERAQNQDVVYENKAVYGRIAESSPSWLDEESVPQKPVSTQKMEGLAGKAKELETAAPLPNHTLPKEKQLDLFEEKLLEPKSRKRHKLIGQLFDTYWLVEFDQNLYIIDQHAAHEKVLYEKTMASLKTREFTSQMVSPPMILTLSGQEKRLLEKYKTYFTEIGFELEPFGDREYALRAVPDNLFSIAKKELFMEMLDNLSDDILKGSPDLIYEKVASMSCKAAVKGNHSMSAMEADHLIDQLLQLENPYACPHGRPTIISMSKYELEKKFKRIV